MTIPLGEAELARQFAASQQQRYSGEQPAGAQPFSLDDLISPRKYWLMKVRTNRCSRRGCHARVNACSATGSRSPATVPAAATAGSAAAAVSAAATAGSAANAVSAAAAAGSNRSRSISSRNSRRAPQPQYQQPRNKAVVARLASRSISSRNSR